MGLAPDMCTASSVFELEGKGNTPNAAFPTFQLRAQELEKSNFNAKREADRQSGGSHAAGEDADKESSRQTGREVERLNPQQGSTRGKESQDKSFDRARFVCHSCYPAHPQSPLAGPV